MQYINDIIGEKRFTWNEAAGAWSCSLKTESALERPRWVEIAVALPLPLGYRFRVSYYSPETGKQEISPLADSSNFVSRVWEALYAARHGLRCDVDWTTGEVTYVGDHAPEHYSETERPVLPPQRPDGWIASWGYEKHHAQWRKNAVLAMRRLIANERLGARGDLSLVQDCAGAGALSMK